MHDPDHSPYYTVSSFTDDIDSAHRHTRFLGSQRVSLNYFEQTE